jgi:RNA polymerase sigma-70 factor (ECF subfamily)
VRPSQAPFQASRAHAPIGLDALYRAHAQAVARWAFRLGGPSVDPEEIVQEVFLIAAQKIASFRGDAAVTTWLYRITENVARHQRRKGRLRRVLFGDSQQAIEEAASLRPTPIEEMERREATSIVYDALDRLSDKERTLLILFELEGLSGEEIAELTGTKIGTVWVHLHRARARFLKALQESEQPAPASAVLRSQS